MKIILPVARQFKPVTEEFCLFQNIFLKFQIIIDIQFEKKNTEVNKISTDNLNSSKA